MKCYIIGAQIFSRFNPFIQKIMRLHETMIKILNIFFLLCFSRPLKKDLIDISLLLIFVAQFFSLHCEREKIGNISQVQTHQVILAILTRELKI